MKRFVLVTQLLALCVSFVAFCASFIAACSSVNQEELRKAAAEARAKVNQYCDARQKTLDALGAAGAQP